MFEQAKEVVQDLSLLVAAESVRLKAVLELQATQMKLSHQKIKILEAVDILLLAMTAYLSLGLRRAERNSCLIRSIIHVSGLFNHKEKVTVHPFTGWRNWKRWKDF